MVTKQQAAQLRQQFVQALPDRIDAAIISTAMAGGNSVVVSFAPATTAAAQTLTNTYVTAGWSTSSVDAVAKTITIAP